MGDGPITSVPFWFLVGSLNFPTRWDATDSDVSSNISQLLSPALQQSSHCKLGSRVESCWWVGRNSVTGHGADHDDLTISHIVLGHQVHWELGAETQSKNIHIQHLPPRLHGSFTEVLCRWESSIVDADIHLAQLRLGWDPVEHGPDVCLRTQITSSREKLATTQVIDNIQISKMIIIAYFPLLSSQSLAQTLQFFFSPGASHNLHPDFYQIFENIWHETL